MGSSQSSPTTSSAPSAGSGSSSQDAPLSVEDSEQASKQRSKEEKSEKEKSLTGMALVNFRCRKKKAKYDKCVSKFYSKQFMGGLSMNQEEECGDKFEAYRECILKGIKKEVWNEEWGQPKEGSPLAEIEDKE